MTPGAMTDDGVLFDGQVGGQRVRVWIERRGGGLAVLSHDMGPGLEAFFGKDELETFLEVDAADVPALMAALGAGDRDPAEYLADRYRGDATATTHLRHFLTERRIPHRFQSV
jgi:hypothetical protein